jgi:trimethylamine--corrinoid protein Co-methyltransferase
MEGGRFQPLSSDEVEKIHLAAVKVLGETGVQIQDSDCRQILVNAGARLDKSSSRVLFAPEMILRALSTINREVVLYSRDGSMDLHLSGKRVHMGTGGAAVTVLDLYSGNIRDSRLLDLFDIGRLVDTLHHIHFYLRPVVARDLDNDVIDVNTFYACLAATRKHVMGGCYFADKVADIKEMAVMLAGSEEAFLSRPFISMNLGFMVSPLRFATETVETLTAAIRAGIPVSLVSAPLAGATAPAALAGTLVQVVAEELAGIVYAQLLKPGHPILMGGMPLVVDLRTGNMIAGTAELALMNAAAAQMAHYYGLPIYNSCGLTESKLPDIQAGFEKGLTSAVTALAGAQFNHHSAGMLESMLAVAYEQYVIDDDINGQVLRLVRGIEVNESTLSTEVIRDVCLGDGHFLGHPQTLELMNSEFHYPHTADRASRADWLSAGGASMRDRARDHARKVLDTHFPIYIPEELDSEIRSRFPIELAEASMKAAGS